MPDLITLTDKGLYCAEGAFYIDAWRPVEKNIVTHGHGDHAHYGMAEYLSTPETIEIMKWRLGDNNYKTLNYNNKTKIGNVWVSLHPAGHILGSAQVRVENKSGEVWVFTGDFKRDADPTCKAFEVVSCDVFICEATFAYPMYSWPDIQEEIHDLVEWLRECRIKNRAGLLFAYSLGKAQRVLAELIGQIEEPVLLHGAMLKGVEIYRRLGIAMHPTMPFLEIPKGTDLSGRLIIAPPSAQNSAWTKRLGSHESAVASGWMQLRGNRRRRNVHRGFVISDHVDWHTLIQTIRETGAKRVLATHGNTDLLIPYLQQSLNIKAERLSTVYGDQEINDSEVNDYE